MKLAEKTECSRKDLRNLPAMSSKAAKFEGSEYEPEVCVITRAACGPGNLTIDCDSWGFVLAVPISVNWELKIATSYLALDIMIVPVKGWA